MTLSLVFLMAGAILGAILGVFFTEIYQAHKNKKKYRRELQDNENVRFDSGSWYAAWQTEVEGSELLNTETIEISQDGATVRMRNCAPSPENPKGGYMWESEMRLFQGKYLLGWYLPAPHENITSKGTMFCVYFPSRSILYGRWVGCAHDGDLASGLFVFSKQRQLCLDELRRIVNTHRNDLTTLRISI